MIVCGVCPCLLDFWSVHIICIYISACKYTGSHYICPYPMGGGGCMLDDACVMRSIHANMLTLSPSILFCCNVFAVCFRASWFSDLCICCIHAYQKVSMLAVWCHYICPYPMGGGGCMHDDACAMLSIHANMLTLSPSILFCCNVFAVCVRASWFSHLGIYTVYTFFSG